MEWQQGLQITGIINSKNLFMLEGWRRNLYVNALGVEILCLGLFISKSTSDILLKKLRWPTQVFNLTYDPRVLNFMHA